MTHYATEADRLIHQKHHELRNATAIGGIIVAAAAGGIAGPIGMVVGGLIGGAAALMGGVILEREEHRAYAHDCELDETIGVTSSELGAAELAAASLDRMEAKAATSSTSVELAADLACHL